MKAIESTAPTLADYVKILRRRKVVVISTVLIVAGVAFFLSLQQTKVYRASADVLLSRQSGLADALLQTTDPTLSTDPIRVASTQTGIARLPEVAKRAVKGVPDHTAADLLGNSSVSSSTNSDILTLSVDDPSPAMAIRLANAYANAYTTYSLTLATTTLRNARLELQQKIAALQRQGDRRSVTYQALQTNVQRLETIELLQNPSTVVNRATDATKVRPTPKRDALLGALFGVVLGCALAFLWNALDKRVESEGEVEEWLDLPMLSRLPPPTRRLSAEHRLAMIDDPGDVHAESIRRLRVKVEFANLEQNAHSMLITSSVQQEGKSTTIANLAVALARAGRSVVLVDLDLRRPALASFFGVGGTVGVTDVALGRVPLDRALVHVGVGGPSSSNGETPYYSTPARVGRNASKTLTVLPAGELPPDPGEFVGSLGLRNLLVALRERYELVLIDAPPMCVVGDAMTLSANVDAIVVVARLGLVDADTLRELARELRASPATKLGFVLTGVDRQDHYGRSGYYGHEKRRAEPQRADQQRGTAASA
jgi:Mrp family chromosome partitioning ATPase/capsular polysaccharide biosynthesis protein